MVSAAKVKRGDALWAQEVARVLEAAPDFEPAVRVAVLMVLESLADDPTESPETRRDVRALLEALNREAADTGAMPGAVPAELALVLAA